MSFYFKLYSIFEKFNFLSFLLPSLIFIRYFPLDPFIWKIKRNGSKGAVGMGGGQENVLKEKITFFFATDEK